jgi:hypothetical protein
MLLLLVACSPPDTAPDDTAVDTADDTDTDTDDTDPHDTGPHDTGPEPCLDPADPCCNEVVDALWACSDDLPEETSVTGTFASVRVTPDGQYWSFVGDDGTTATVFLTGAGAGLDLVPDLAAFGTVTVTDAGGCGSDGEGAEVGTFSVIGDAGQPLFAVASAGTGHAGELAVTWDETDDTCPNRASDGCFDVVRNHSVVFLDGTEYVRLFQGQEGALSGVTAHLLMAMQAASASHCDDVGGNMENWVVVGTP